MEKRGALISRLQEQYSEGADNTALLNTALMLVAELQNTNGAAAEKGKVSVIMPYKPFEAKPHVNGTHVEVATPEQPKETEPVEPVAEQTEQPVMAELKEEKREPVAEIQEATIQEPVKEETLVQEAPEPVQTSAINTLAEEKYNDVIEAIPTLAQQQPKLFFELNDTMQSEEQSINDKIKLQSKEAAHKVMGEPIRDLKKAIGVNDKYLFVRELFRNDETAYERSLKTINSFNILPEAEYWIQREMKYKLGWDDNNPTVQAFYQLVKRRFS